MFCHADVSGNDDVNEGGRGIPRDGEKMGSERRGEEARKRKEKGFVYHDEAARNPLNDNRFHPVHFPPFCPTFPPCFPLLD